LDIRDRFAVPTPGAITISAVARTPTTRRLGRRPGDSRTREAILAAARSQFYQHGLSATLRGIARAADVDPALVLHFYGSKDALFVEAMEWPFDFDDAVAQIVIGARSKMGRRLADFFLSIWEDPVLREPVVGLLRAAAASAQAAELLRDVLGQRLFGQLAMHLGGDDAGLRVSLCSSQLIGIGVARYIVKLEPVASMERDAVAAALAPVLQRYLTGPSPAGSP
jgi:AcrR family transcriptional regulator